MTIRSEHNRHPGFLQSGQLTLLGAAIIVLLIFAWSSRPCIEQSNGPVSLSPFQSWPDCIINMSGYDFRKGQVADAAVEGHGQII
jgi:hypothetical protein